MGLHMAHRRDNNTKDIMNIDTLLNIDDVEILWEEVLKDKLMHRLLCVHNVDRYKYMITRKERITEDRYKYGKWSQMYCYDTFAEARKQIILYGNRVSKRECK
jgi:hypothetical protein